jgi:hypothetical protein
VPPVYDTAGRQAGPTGWLQTPVAAPGRKRHWFRSALVALVILAGAAWVLPQVNPSSGHLEGSLVRRVLGDDTTANLEATYRGMADAVRSAKSRLTGAHPRVVPTVSASLPAPVRSRAVAAVPPVQPTPVVTSGRAPGQGIAAAVGQAGGSAVAQSRSDTSGSTVRTTTARLAAAHRAPLALPAALLHLPASAYIPNDYQVYETWNNCGPASLSMALSYFGIHESQQVLGEILRPYENTTGDNDDKDVTFEELAGEARTFGLLAYYRPDGNMQLLKRFLAIGLPVVAETVMTTNDDIGHYRVVKGYNASTGMIIQDDSMQGHDVQFSYADFDSMWKKYNYEYLVLAPKSKQRLVEAILGKDLDARTAWENTVKMDEAALAQNPGDVDSTFNLSVADYYVGDYRGSVQAYEQVQAQLPFRTLWYQIEPIESYSMLGDYQRVFTITASILNDGNRAFSQLYILRGEIDKKEGNLAAARAEFQNAVTYNIHLKAAQEALASVS